MITVKTRNTKGQVKDHSSLSSIIEKVYNAYQKGNESGDNQNCMLCTWATELQIRGEDVLPRPVYSPRDVIFTKINGGEHIVKNPTKISIKNKDDVADIVSNAGQNSRFYVHINWKNSKAGHEFLLLNIQGIPYVVDAQANYLQSLEEDKTYFQDIDFANSYLVRLDDKEVDYDILDYNKPEYITPWEDELDIPLLAEESYNKLSSDHLSIDGVDSPEQLLDWMSTNIEYELAEAEYSDDSDALTKTARDVLKTKRGHCAEQSYLEKAVLDALGYETQLIFVKENSSQQDYGPDGSAHVFLIYKDEEDNFCWFEHAMEHARGIHKYQNLADLLQDVANKWWRYDEGSDILEVRFLDNPITEINNWQLAQACYDYPVGYIFDISNNKMEEL